MEILPDRLDPLMVQILRSKLPAEKLEMAAGMTRFARELMRRTLVNHHPNWTVEQIEREVVSRIARGLV